MDVGPIDPVLVCCRFVDISQAIAWRAGNGRTLAAITVTMTDDDLRVFFWPPPYAADVICATGSCRLLVHSFAAYMDH